MADEPEARDGRLVPVPTASVTSRGRADQEIRGAAGTTAGRPDTRCQPKLLGQDSNLQPSG
jgi:hypothetical protein